MSISDHDLYQSLSEIKDAVAQNHTAICQRLTAMETSLKPFSEQLSDHEDRLRAGEEFRWKATGILGLVVLGWESLAHYLFKK